MGCVQEVGMATGPPRVQSQPVPARGQRTRVSGPRAPTSGHAAHVLSLTPRFRLMRTWILLSALVLLPAAPLAAQMSAQGASPGGAAPTAVASVRDLWQTSRDFILAAAEQLPEAEYAFQPTPDVRTLGQLFVHVAESQRMLCAMALGEKNDARPAPATKAAIVAALRASNDYCARAYTTSDADAMSLATPSDATSASIFGTTHTRFYVLATNAWHDNEHYGNVVTYMRLRGLVPPSSQPRAPAPPPTKS
jgi:uncharacterized damage-inducible protein DinB